MAASSFVKVFITYGLWLRYDCQLFEWHYILLIYRKVVIIMKFQIVYYISDECIIGQLLDSNITIIDLLLYVHLLLITYTVEFLCHCL